MYPNDIKKFPIYFQKTLEEKSCFELRNEDNSCAANSDLTQFEMNIEQ